jgi:glycosyltransferase involved in cell wall biosynthesis
MNFEIFIDGSNLGGSGGLTHLKELLTDCRTKVSLIAQNKVLVEVPDSQHLTKINHPFLEKSLIHRLYFQFFVIDKLIPKNAILFSITGDFLGKHKPVVSMSQNMLLYERDIWKEIKDFKETFRFWINYLKQKRSFKNSNGIIFISNYAKNYITNKLSLEDKTTTVINHGISQRFFGKVKPQKAISEYTFSQPFRFTYSSTIHVYKNHCNVVEAIAKLRTLGYPVELHLVGGVIFKPAGDRLINLIQQVDPLHQYISYHGHLPYEEMHQCYNAADGLIFASTCENMPNILIESMSSGIPLVCSNKEPMPEFLKGNGFYFNANNIESICQALIEFLQSPTKRYHFAQNALKESYNYSWKETRKKTFDFINQSYQNYLNVQQ